MEACRHLLRAVFVLAALSPPSHQEGSREEIEKALETIEEVASNNLGELCVSQSYRLLSIPLTTHRFESVRGKVDMASLLVQDLALSRTPHVLFSTHPQLHTLVDGVAHTLLAAEKSLLTARVLAVNTTTGLVSSCSVWRRERGGLEWRDTGELLVGVEVPQTLPWFPATGVFQPRAPGSTGLWTFPYYYCQARSWVLSYSVAVSKHGNTGYVSVDVDITRLHINQCDSLESNSSDMIEIFKGSHKCHNSTKCVYSEGERRWARGSYVCRCKPGYYMPHPQVPFLGNLVEAAWSDILSNGSSTYETFRCEKCAPGCTTCVDRRPCLASYNWPFRIILMSVSGSCIFLTLCLIGYVYHHRRMKVFKVASPIFLCITLIGCVVMYLEMAAIFPILDTYSCIATKWSRHLGFCVTYTALLMKTWRVSLTYRVKSAHKVKLTDKQLLQWMFPILLVMLIYLGTWTLSAPPTGEDIRDSEGLIFKQCTYNWWDHSIAIGEVLFLAWGIRVCYNVRNAESLFNEARLISYAIYNIALVNTAMVAFHLFLFPQAGPDIKYLLGFIRTQLSTTVTVALVFGPKVVRVMRGQGDQWDKRARARAVTASFSLNGIGLVADETTDLYQENEELKEEIQKLASQIEFMKIVSMEVNNRHVKPKPGGYFSTYGGNLLLQSPRTPREPSTSAPGESRDQV